MAVFQIVGRDRVGELTLEKLGAELDRIAQKALFEAGGIVADHVRAKLEALPEDKQNPKARYRYLQDGERFTGIPRHQKEDLLDALGVTPPMLDQNGNWNVKVGFESELAPGRRGYGRQRTRTYPKGQPLMMIARSVESGSSIQPKMPFFRPAVEESKQQAIRAMNATVDLEMIKIGKYF